MSQIIDLNELKPESITVKIADKEVEITPPTTSQVFKLGRLGKKISDTTDSDTEEVENLSKEMVDMIYEIVPELNGIELYTAQVFKLFEIISDLASVKGGEPSTLKA